MNALNVAARVVARRVLPIGARRTLVRLLRHRAELPSSEGYAAVEGEVPEALLHGWQDEAVPERQWRAFAPVLRALREGQPRQDFVALANSVVTTGIENPLVVEVGCGGGWNSEVLARLVNKPLRYVGLDYSTSMVEHARRQYPGATFLAGDATALPLRDRCCDILLSGTVLMHLLGYREAIAESRRVTRRWCILHAVPVVARRPTTVLRKLAYGSPVVEVVFNEQELLDLARDNGMVVREVLDCFPYDIGAVTGEPTSNRTYLCEVS